MSRGLYIWLLCLAVLMLFFVGARYNPVAFLAAGILAPLPVLMAGWRLGERAALALIAAMAGMIFAAHPDLAAFKEHLGFGELMLMGLLLGSLQYRGCRADQAIILSVLALSLLALILAIGHAYYSGSTFQELLALKTREITDLLEKMLASEGGSGKELTFMGLPRAELQGLLQSLLPALMLTNTGVVAWINVILARQVTVLLRGPRPEPPLYYWSPPEWLIFVALGSGFLLLIPLPVLRLVCLNLLLVAGLLYFCQGVAVIAAWFQRLRLPRFLRVVGYSLLFLNPLFFLIITLGLMDLWLDFRRLRQSEA